MNFNQYVKGNTLKLLSPTGTINVNKLVSFLQSNTRITQLTLFACGISDRDIEVLANSPCVKRLKKLDLDVNEIGDEGAKALANSPYLANLKELVLSTNNIGGEGIEALARSQGSRVIDFYISVEKIFYDFLLSKKYSNSQVIDEKSVKEMIFDTARRSNGASIVKYILKQPNEYPFLINSRDEEGHTLSHFYTHFPEMQKFLFEHGLIPEQERNQRGDDARIVQDSQSVHDKLVVKRTNFFAKKLVESTKVSEEQLNQAVTSYVNNIPKLLEQYQNNQVKIGLLGLKENEKKSVMKEVLNGGDVPSDEEFIKTVIDKAEQALKQQYLKKNSRGEYDQGHPTNRMQYDYARDDAKITIPESIGYIKLLIDNFSVPLKEKKELLVTLMEQNPDLVKNKLSKVKEKLGNSVILDKEQFNKTELHGLLNGIDDGKKVDELFKEISDLDIEKIWREQKEFVLLKQIYIAATTYGENSSACIQGTWSQIIGSINEISSEIVAQYYHYLEEEQKQEMQRDAVTEENITPFVENLAKKLIQHARSNPEFKEDLVDNFILRGIDLDRTKNIQFEQQKVLAKINQEFSANIKSFLPNYDRSIPKEDEYKIIIKELFKVKAMQDLAQEPSNQQENITGEMEAQIDGDSKRSKLSIVVASTLAVAGIISGVAIAAHLEMLAVGIVVGACCPVAAAIIYYCNEPSKSLENSKVQGFSEKVR